MSALSGVSIGVDVGGTKVLLGAIGRSGELGATVRVDTPASIGELGVVVRQAVEDLLERVEDGLEAIGVALPGLVDRSGVLYAAPNLGAADQPVDLNAELGGLVAGVPVIFDNDATSAAVAEFEIGAARGVANAVIVSLGTGIGAGVFCDGELVRGWRSFAGEVGHMVVQPNGEPCPCGRRGCWERYASGSGLAAIARRHASEGRGERFLHSAGSLESISGEHVTAAARDGDAAALSVIEEWAGWIGLGFANLVELFDPELIVIGGGLVNEADLYLEALREAYLASCRATQARSASDIVLATLGDQAACVGAGLIAFAAVSA